MPRTDKQIADYVIYYSSRTDRKWALENLCRLEKKTPEDIVAICRKFNVRKEVEEVAQKFCDEMKSKILKDREAGASVGDLAEEHDLDKTQIYSILKDERKKAKKAAEKVEPEQEPTTKTKNIKASPKFRNGYWCAVLDQLKDFAPGVIGASATFTALEADENRKYARVKLLTPDNTAICFTMEVIGNGRN